MNDNWITARLMKNNNTWVFRGDNVYASIGGLSAERSFFPNYFI